MKVLSIGTDKNLFKEGSDVRRRIIEYGSLVEELHVVVFTARIRNQESRIRNIKISENTWIYPTRSFNRWFYVYDAVKIGKNILNTKYQLSQHQSKARCGAQQDTAFKGVIHCFTGNSKQAQKFLDLGLYLGFNGLILKNVPALPDPAEIISQIPLDRILLETDAPYLTPPEVQTERNEPLNIHYIVKKIAEIKKVTSGKIAEVTTQNARELFQI